MIPELNKQQINDFNANGFVVVRNAFSPAEMQRIIIWTHELANLPEDSGKHWVYHEKSKLDPNIDLNEPH